MLHALMEMVNRNIRFLDKVDNRSDFDKLIVYSYYLEKIAIKHKLLFLQKVIIKHIRINNDRIFRTETSKLFQKYKDTK